MHVRREVRSLGPGDETLKFYARAVQVMKDRTPSEHTSWAYQAAIHGSEEEPQELLWNQCKHASWFFPPWHRMYVYRFELIVREIVEAEGGPEDWALPYWNYGRNGEFASIPEAFREPTDADGNPNPLYIKERARGINAGARLRPEVTTDEFALSRPNYVGEPEFGGGEGPSEPQFWSLTGRLEQTPHNDVHNAVGGPPPGCMSNPDTAALDPIFWLHHTNIDRIWAEWNAAGKVNPKDAQWAGQGFELFDTHGKPVTMHCSEVDETALLDYTYDTLLEEGERQGAAAPAPAAEAAMANPGPPERKVVGATADALTLVGNSEQVPVSIDDRAKQEVAAATSESDPRRLFLNLEDIEGDTNPGSVYGIYVNLPAGADAETLAKHHVGNVSFFGIERAKAPKDDEHSHGMRVSVEVGEVLRAIGSEDPGGKVDVTLKPLSLVAPPGESEEAIAAPSGEDPPVKIGRVSLTVG
jgi:tyrosinase